ncbi:LTA synthase family protein [Anaerobranca gottschalkii]|uniref:Phosphoglycerol transferase MdoB n=1 Tax=Anaerobranca gottschalkii DSM 13577 TaxID=1120990 RepID=A0A1I0C172_9FIRM|nr:LTA synthase family protein [Anaerobranca gottschalkii]SET12600.1 Phosphoglycerol transferase MdoB [Anaerobranca gottschalkii DSM 13577]
MLVLIISSLAILLKILVLHLNMNIEKFFILTGNNFIIVLGIFSLVYLFSRKNFLRKLLVVNFLISVIFFIDMMYYNHFYTLVPAHSIYQIGQLGPVSESIFQLLNPLYFLFFLDLLIIIILRKKGVLNQNIEKFLSKRKVLVFLLILMLLVGSFNFYISKVTDNYFTPYNLGVINYHIYDLLSFIDRTTINRRHVEALFELIENTKIEKNNYFGLAQGKNVIVIQAESIQNFVINKKINGEYITPVLNELIKNNSFYFSNYFEQVAWGNTSDCEFISNTGFYPSSRVYSYKAYENNDFITLPSSLQSRGYSTIAFHGNYRYFWNRENIYPAQGIERFIGLEDFDEGETIGLGLSDGELFRQSINYLKELPQPFYSFYITVTSHHPFYLPEEYKELAIPEEYQDTVLDYYLQTIRYLDTQIGMFLELLKEEGLYENSIIVIYGDHKGLDMRDEKTYEVLTEFLQKPYDEREMYNVPLIIHLPGEDIQGEVITVGGQVDFFPTMANLLGISLRKDSFFGQDLLNTISGFASLAPHVAPGSFVDNEKIFIMANDGIFENSRAWYLATGEPVDLEKCREGFERALLKIELSEYIMKNNLNIEVHEKGWEYLLEILDDEDGE